MKGFIALITVLIVSSLVLMVGLGLSLGAISAMKMGQQKSFSLESYYLANLCVEESLMKLKENINYSGNESFYFENGSCTILPIEGSWIIKVSATSSNQIKKMKVSVSQINPAMIIDSWQEVADFQ